MFGSPGAKLSLWSLTSLVVGSMIGAGIFSLPATFAKATGGLGAIIAWSIAGGGMLMLALVFQTLARRKPELDAGVFAYADAGFGHYMGFFSALGFWAATCVGNIHYFILIKSTLGEFVPAFGEGDTLAAIGASTLLLWAFHFLILRGVKQAATVNTIATIAKIIPIFVFIVLVMRGFDAQVFWSNFSGSEYLAPSGVDLLHLDEFGRSGHAGALVEATSHSASLFEQVRATMLVTVFVFLGIEGASVYSRYARNREDVGVATVLGFLGVLCLLFSITLLSYGVMPQAELAQLRQPSMAAVLEAVVGRWGAIFIGVGLLISVLGAYLSCTLLAVEVLFSAASHNTMPSFLSRENGHGVPASALWLTTLLTQVFLFVTLFSQYAYSLALELTSALCLVPYLLVAAYALKLVVNAETYAEDARARHKDFVIALLATLYGILMICAGGLKYLLLSALIYAPGTLLFYLARRERNERLFTRYEQAIFAVAVITALLAVYCLQVGIIRI